ncbi:acetoacetyl-CoA reductase [Pseudovibrio sp. Tun.PSC04-5.I4]|uniref:acetoacetyl-CoA reductase n=1 Tax=Pseudovibrio sp. Tun.PSC04-5.I4 TaxID=1798213 RepID=UPI000881CEED|nr:acetoacetyl-CoA reductase [Pseudovibrio sp. Tun.PSC04-5.I4]SDR27836.1 3-oxoacyl-[acyl-carrier-protein] reductase /acetoacetyl-CoA reductase [Pseudovibrio sp. Tun.PSC04-5.I4]
MSRVAIVTGGTRGIGAAISKGLNDAGYTVAATYAGNTEAADKFSAETGIKAYKWDVSDPKACEVGIAQVTSDLGDIEVLVNNAGITRDGWFHKMDYEQWTAVMKTNLDSMFTMSRPVLDGMRERGLGRIINISSINGQKGQIGQTNYSAAKAGVIGFTKALAQETARKGITVNCICPGYIDTDMVAAVPEKVLESIIGQIPVGRLGKAEEIAGMVCYLTSTAAAFVTGSVMTINGAQYVANG